MQCTSLTYILIVVGERASDLQAGILVGIVNDDVVAVTSDVHC